MSPKPKIVIAGINGRFGRVCAKTFLEGNDFELVGALGKPGASYINKDVGTLCGHLDTGIFIRSNLSQLADAKKPDVILDFTEAEASFAIAKQAIESGIKVVIGTSGIKDKEINQLLELANKHKVGTLVVPNFSVGAVLMMEFAKQASAFYKNVEIIEMHHTRKVDSPSGTAMHTIKKLSSSDTKFNEKEVEDHELIKGARGAVSSTGIRVHSLRLPGLISHQEVIFGADGELLTIRHDGLTTQCYLKGIILSIQAVMKLDHFEIGLETVLGIGQNM